MGGTLLFIGLLAVAAWPRHPAAPVSTEPAVALPEKPAPIRQEAPPDDLLQRVGGDLARECQVAARVIPYPKANVAAPQNQAFACELFLVDVASLLHPRLFIRVARELGSPSAPAV